MIPPWYDVDPSPSPSPSPNPRPNPNQVVFSRMRCHRWPEVQTLVERMHASVVGKMEEHRDEPARKKATKQGERIFAAHRANEEAKSLAPQP